MNFDITVVGSCNTDFISYVPRMPSLGETIVGDKFEVGFGGKGANQCVMSSKLGAKVGMVAKVGDDVFGSQTIDNFKSHQVDTRFVYIAEGVSSGVAPICVTPGGENTIVIIPGANNFLTTLEVDRAIEMINVSKVLLCQLEIPPAVTLHALKLARDRKVITILNTAPAIPLFNEFYIYTDILCMNESECKALCGIMPDSTDERSKAIIHFIRLGVACVILTLGESGVVYGEKEDPKRIVSIPALVVKAVDTAGAGDAFVGALAYFLACKQELPLEDKIMRSTHIASLSVTRSGTQKSYQSKHELSSELFK
ncbi:Ribokinase-like [Oopsacas minuta]|uniref:Ribokinase n=1 Tax=Oopsacas minuta TaxID=111878 RepID=A0AAV7JDL8_9METZ|nr:Ribokinase-like [Oopsacas minuta]